MNNAHSTAKANIHLRASASDVALIDQAAALIGAKRSQFMLACALKEARSVIHDQTLIEADANAFLQILDWLDRVPTATEIEGLRRLAEAKVPWQQA